MLVLRPVPTDGNCLPSLVPYFSGFRRNWTAQKNSDRARWYTPRRWLIFDEVFMKLLATLALFAALGVVLGPMRAGSSSAPAGLLFIANQFDHTANLVDLSSRHPIGKIGVDVNGHEVAVSPDHKLGYVPIYGNSGVGKPGTDGATVQVIDLKSARAIRIIDLGKPVRPHCA